MLYLDPPESEPAARGYTGGHLFLGELSGLDGADGNNGGRNASTGASAPVAPASDGAGSGGGGGRPRRRPTWPPGATAAADDQVLRSYARVTPECGKLLLIRSDVRNAHDVQPVFGLGARYSITFFFSHWPVPRILILSIAEDFCVD